ncbi:hypothetical protein [Streptomyces avicenniae]|uniref:hypothetical protein n=1 Tax=Streptomyces avicenniae TaxID=500153 RepID=UPI00069A0424|nr:hypothetical protein [Streptomyces avicenniae]
MDIDAALALVSTAAGSVATAAGQHAWDALLSVVRRVTGRGAGSLDDGPVDPADEGQVQALTGRIAERARTDAVFADALLGWAADHRRALTAVTGDTHNSIAGGAVTNGPVVQLRDVHGDVTFGQAP